MTVRQWCFPSQVRRVWWGRPLSLGLRALHLAAVAFLLGGHAHGAAAEALFPWLVVALTTGAALIVPEVSAWGLYWFALAKGVSVLAKLGLLAAIPFAWEARVPILAGTLVWSAITSHMPARLRNYSFLHGRPVGPADELSRTRGRHAAEPTPR